MVKWILSINVLLVEQADPITFYKPIREFYVWGAIENEVKNIFKPINCIGAFLLLNFSFLFLFLLPLSLLN